MKRVLLLSLFLVGGALMVQAFRQPGQSPRFISKWAEDKNVSAARNYTEGSSQPKPKYKFEEVSLLPRILRGDPVRIDIYPAIEDKNILRQVQHNLITAYNYDNKSYGWFKNAVKWIDAENRQGEFSDVWETLNKGVNFKFIVYTESSTDKDLEADLIVTFVEDPAEIQYNCGCKKNGLKCAGCVQPGKPMSLMMELRGYYHVLVHELGHTLGLADAYEEGYQENASATNRSAVRVTDSIMYYANSTQLTADDADGLINMIDAWNITQAQAAHPNDWCKYIPARVKNGWKSLYRTQSGISVDFYQMGKSASLLKEDEKCGPVNAAQQTNPGTNPPGKRPGLKPGKLPPGSADND